MKSSKVELDAMASAEARASTAADAASTGTATGVEDASPGAGTGAMSLTFFLNHNGAPIADLYMGKRRLIATNHPATIVAAMFAMDETRLTVVTSVGSHTGTLRFLGRNEEGITLLSLKILMSALPESFQFLQLAPDESYRELLKGLDIFPAENWHEPNDVCDEYIRAAYHHLPPDVIKRPLLKPEPKGWKKTLKRRNKWIYFPDC